MWCFLKTQLRWTSWKTRNNIISPGAHHWDIPWCVWIRFPVVISICCLHRSQVASTLVILDPWQETVIDMTHWLQKNPNFIHFLPGSCVFSWRIPRPLRVNPRCSLALGNACVTCRWNWWSALCIAIHGCTLLVPSSPWLKTPPYFDDFFQHWNLHLAGWLGYPTNIRPLVSPCQPVKRF